MIDNLTLEFENKEVPKNSRFVRNYFIELLKKINLCEEDHIDENTYQEYRKSFINKYKSFAEKLKTHLKKDQGHIDC